MTTRAPTPRVTPPVGSLTTTATGTRRLVRDALRRDPDDRWAAAFGLIAGYSFAMAAATGILLLPFFRPSMATVVYHGSYAELNGVPVSQAFVLLSIPGTPGPGLLPPRPADLANRIAVGAAGATFYGLLWAASANDQIAYHLHLDLYTVAWSFRVLVVAGPAMAFLITRLVCHTLAALPLSRAPLADSRRARGARAADVSAVAAFYQQAVLSVTASE